MLYVQRIRKEVPVPLGNKDTKEAFDNAVAKAKILYREVEVDERCQAAIVTDDKGKQSIIYTSSVDNEIYTYNSKYRKIRIKNIRDNATFKTGFYLAEGFGTYGEYGLIKHNGLLMIPASHVAIQDIDKTFIKCDRLMNVGGRVTLWDYKGHLWLDEYGLITVRPSPVINKNKIRIFMTNRKDGDGNEGNTKIYAIYKGEIYSVFEFPTRIGNYQVIATTKADGIELKTVNMKVIEGSKKRKISAKELMESAHKLEKGKTPEFTWLNIET